ncbi:MAG: hypothetical protein WAW73_01160 [Rhodoferax sp.]
MSESSPTISSSASAARLPARPLATDTMVYLVLVTLTWLVWQISRQGYFEAGDDVGYWLGVVGGVMMLLLFTYPLRKHFRFAHGWGRVKWWFLVHMLLGVGGPMLILLHSTFHVGSLNAAVALYSMLIVALSGVVGRFIYARVHRGLRGEEVSLKELQAYVVPEQEDVRSRLAFAPTVEARLRDFEQTELKARPGWLTYFRQVFLLPVKQLLVYRQCVAELQQPIRKLAAHSQWSADDLVRRERQARKLVRRYLTAVVKVAHFTAYEKLFSLWHVAHIPFVYLLVISAVVHVIAVHAY